MASHHFGSWMACLKDLGSNNDDILRHNEDRRKRNMINNEIKNEKIIPF